MDVRLFTGFKETIQTIERFIDSIQVSTTGFKVQESGVESAGTKSAVTR